MSLDLRSSLMQKRSSRAKEARPANLSPAMIRELVAFTGATIRLAWIRLPGALVKSAAIDPAFDDAGNPARALEVVGSALLEYMNDLGPIYGKAGQILLSRLDPDQKKIAEALQLDRLYGRWPALDVNDVIAILDRSSPSWRKYLRRLDPVPLGVASIGQAHAATDHKGREWVVKVIKPEAKTRLNSTVAAMEQALFLAEPLALTRAAAKVIEETRELCAAFRGEISLRRELDTIQRVRAAMNDGKKQQLLRVPKVYEECCSDDVLVVERFRGTMLSDVVSGHAKIAPERRQLLAKKVLQDLLVQVFELGLFHADPHAGNLILLDDGTVGLFDWGLSGELLPSDRKHIATVLKALIGLDFDGLVDALEGIATDAGRAVDRQQIENELRGFAKTLTVPNKKNKKPSIKSRSNTKAPTLQKMLDDCLRAAERLGIPVPSGLLMMAKTLVTVEGLARGIDPEIKLARAATPVLLRVARPGIKDLWKLANRLPGMLRQYSKSFSAVALPALWFFSSIISQQGHAATAVLGDSLSTGGGAHPAIQYDPRSIWGIMRGKVAVVPKAADIPAASDWKLEGADLPAPVVLTPGAVEYRGASANVSRAFIHAGSTAFLNTAQYSYAYLLARRFGETADQIFIAAENGARMENAAAQAHRVIRHMSTSGVKRLDRVFILFGGNDICAPALDMMSPPEDFKTGAIRALRVLRQHVANSGAYSVEKPLEVHLLQPLPMVQLLSSEVVLGKKIMAFGSDTTCKELQARSFAPAKPIDYSNEPEAGQLNLVSQFLPPSPALICATMFGRLPPGESSDDRNARIANRIRGYREALVDAVERERREASRSGVGQSMKFNVVDGSGALQFKAADIAGDCFHLSAVGQEALARTVLEDLRRP